MPEGPEVQTVLNTLQDKLNGAVISRVEIHHPKLPANLPPDEFARALQGQTICGFSRIGKYLILITTDYDWVIHLRMEGKFFVLDHKPDPREKHMHAMFELADGRCLVYHDVRKFGRMYLHKKEEEHPQGNWRSLPVFANVGKDALDPDLHASELYEKTKKRSVPLKNVLLDQSVIAGIGNIYADEILFEAGLSPFCKANHLDESDWQKILDATRRILNDASSCGGTTIRTFSYGNSHAGSYQDQLQIHGKEGECLRCHGKIVHTKVGQRGTWYCPQCQIEK